jgi:hypothetical protein
VGAAVACGGGGGATRRGFEVTVVEMRWGCRRGSCLSVFFAPENYGVAKITRSSSDVIL